MSVTTRLCVQKSHRHILSPALPTHTPLRAVPSTKAQLLTGFSFTCQAHTAQGKYLKPAVSTGGTCTLRNKEPLFVVLQLGSGRAKSISPQRGYTARGGGSRHGKHGVFQAPALRRATAAIGYPHDSAARGADSCSCYRSKGDGGISASPCPNAAAGKRACLRGHGGHPTFTAPSHPRLQPHIFLSPEQLAIFLLLFFKGGCWSSSGVSTDETPFFSSLRGSFFPVLTINAWSPQQQSFLPPFSNIYFALTHSVS